MSDAAEAGDYVTVTLEIRKEVYERAKADVAVIDPATSPLCEFAGMMDVEEYLVMCLSVYFKR